MPKWVPRTIEFIWVRWNPLRPHTKIIPSQNHLFRDPFFGLKRSPGQNVGLRAPKSDPGLQNPPPGMKKQKMRAEKPCRTPPSELQTEPYSASYDQKPFWKVPSKSWHMLQAGKSCFREGKSCFHGRKSYFKKGNPAFRGGPI